MRVGPTLFLAFLSSSTIDLGAPNPIVVYVVLEVAMAIVLLVSSSYHRAPHHRDALELFHPNSIV
jgi:predicted membrane channel-forming protein YqfA (hemolysin III family)